MAFRPRRSRKPAGYGQSTKWTTSSAAERLEGINNRRTAVGKSRLAFGGKVEDSLSIRTSRPNNRLELFRDKATAANRSARVDPMTDTHYAARPHGVIKQASTQARMESINKRLAAKGMMLKGGGAGGRYKRVPAGSSRGGQFTS